MSHSRDKKLWLRWWIVLASFVATVQAQHRSNIVFIMVDDMGWNDVSFHGSDQILTPNIDTMAYRGIILQQYYSEPVCTPARTALLTGKYPMRLGMQGFPLYNSEDRGIPLTERLLPSYLKELGYSTHLVGKWHVGMSRKEYLPTSRGYDTHYGMRGGFIDYYTYNKVETLPNGTSLFGMDLFDNDMPQETEERYIVDALTDRAVKIIQHHNTTCPLFLHVTHNAPHAGNPGSALQPPLNSGGGVKHRHIAHSSRRLFAEVVNNIDRSVAKVVKALEDKGILDDTLIIFVSDNGAPTVGTNGNWGVNLPLRGIKYTPWEGALRVPAFMWHSSFQPRIWNGLMHISDWLPTLTAAVGGQFQAKIDGVNQWGAITKDTESKRKEVLLAVEDSNRNVYAAYRAGDYKIVVGNVTGLNNGYYGADFMRTKNGYQPDYFATLTTCKVAKIFERMGIYLDFFGVLATRAMATIKQEDPVRDRTPCLPSPSRGCLFNVRRDPTESHDLWDRASKIVVLLTSRLRGLWASQLKRGPPNIQTQADPANFNYLWTPWITCNSNATKSQKIIQFDERSLLLNFNGNINTEAKTVNCNGTTGIKNFLCILRSYF